ncbi:hypothetical protein BGZ79_007154 [Entomortierella chlamydospora]|nr:hypothetical protein BGZ79_007154 [Entomortierella chlamydospora]
MSPPAGCLDAFRGIFSSSQANALNTSNGQSSINGSSLSVYSGIQAPLAIVDMGSNGIRFGIIASLDRHLPVLYEERASISLFEAQFSSDPDDDGEANEDSRKTLVATEGSEPTLKAPNPIKNGSGSSERRPISKKVIREVVGTFQRWKALCQQANVQNVRVIATEATRTAPNSKEFLDTIKTEIGWTVELLSKHEEAKIGALGVMASYHTVQGLFMDLGGGSVQLNYIIRGPSDGQGKSSSSAQSWPYGAAALSRRLNNCGNDKAARDDIHEEMKRGFRQGLKDINIDPEVKKHEDGYRMYLSGGGFRSLGYLLMAEKMKKDKGSSRYPIPIINGYVATRKELAKVVEKYRNMAPEEVETSFRVSARRAKLIPACATLMAAVLETIDIKDVLFSEGGVRQGGCFGMLPLEIQNKDPAEETVRSFVEAFGGGQPPLHSSDLVSLSSFVSSALPSDFANCCRLSSASTSEADESHSILSPKDAADLQVFIDSLPRLIPLLVMVMNCYNQLPKEARSTAAWQLFLPGGALANCYGLTHGDRAILATVLAKRHEGDLADPDTGDAIKKLIPGGKIAREAVKYLGKVLALGGLCSPLPGMATMLFGSGGVPKHGTGHISFEQLDPSTGHRDRRDNDKTHVGGEHSLDGTGDDDLVVLQAGYSPTGEPVHGHVVIRVYKDSPILNAPNVQDAIKSLTEAASNTHGFTGSLVRKEPDMGKGKGVHHAG